MLVVSPVAAAERVRLASEVLLKKISARLLPEVIVLDVMELEHMESL